MIEGLVIFLPSFDFMDRKLKLALDLPHKKIVDHDIICGFIEFIFNSDYFELIPHLLAIIKEIHSFQDTDKGIFPAVHFGSEQISDSKHN